MKLKNLILVLVTNIISITSIAQNRQTDSSQVSKIMFELFSLCRKVDFTDPDVLKLGTFYKAAPFIIYRGDDKKRNWKDFANYNNGDEKRRVDNVCERINQTANQDSAFKITRYITETESEGTWHVLIVSYKKKGKEKTTAYAFLKIGSTFGLGDID